AILEDIERTGAERIVAARIGAAFGGCELAQFGLAGDHVARRRPARPFRLPLDRAATGPGKAVLAEADAIADRLALRLNQIEIVLARIDNDRAGRFLCLIGD